MIPTELLATAEAPGQDAELRLYRHDRDFMVRVGGLELMGSRETGSEELLAELALARLPDPSTARVLVGGLGLGFTLARTLALIGPEGTADVVELVPAIVDWNRRWFGDLTGHPLRDPRVTVVEGDVRHRIRGSKSAYDALLLDVDNGPKGLVTKSNDALYSKAGLQTAAEALRPGGVLAIWSIDSDPAFAARIRSAGFKVTEERVRARRNKGPRRTIWLATPTGR